MAVNWAWQGAVTSTTAVIKANVTGAATLVLSTHADLSSPTTIGPVTPTADGMVTFTATGLAPLTQYYWGIQVAGTVDATKQGKLRTFPTEGQPASFTFAASACAGGQSGGITETNHVIFDVIRQRNPAFFLHMGDLHYRDIATNDVALFRAGYDAVLAQSNQAQMYRETPLAYMYSDHDAGPNDCDNTTVTRPAARQAYQERAPHYPLPLGETGNVPPFQEFVYGRVRFFMPDCRLERDPSATTDGAGKSRLGAAQKALLKQRMLAATEPLLVLVAESPWIALPRSGSGGDDWGFYAYERDELSKFFVDNGLNKRMIIVASDLHALACDDGSNNRYRDSGIPVFQCGPLDRGTLTYSGPYTSGIVNNSTVQGHYGLFSITDNGGDAISYSFTGQQVTP